MLLQPRPLIPFVASPHVFKMSTATAQRVSHTALQVEYAPDAALQRVSSVALHTEYTIDWPLQRVSFVALTVEYNLPEEE